MTKPNPFRCFKTSPEIIRLAVMLHIRFPLSLRNVEDLLHERGVDISHGFTHPIEPAPGRLAGFERWDDLVRQTVHWVNSVLEPGMFGDPMEIVREATAKDSVKEALFALLVELREQFGEQEFSAREVHDHATDGTSLERALTDLADDQVAVSSRRIGRTLKSYEGRLVNGARLASRHDPARNARMFRVEGNLPPTPF